MVSWLSTRTTKRCTLHKRKNDISYTRISRRYVLHAPSLSKSTRDKEPDRACPGCYCNGTEVQASQCASMCECGSIVLSTDNLPAHTSYSSSSTSTHATKHHAPEPSKVHPRSNDPRCPCQRGQHKLLCTPLGLVTKSACPLPALRGIPTVGASRRELEILSPPAPPSHTEKGCHTTWQLGTPAQHPPQPRPGQERRRVTGANAARRTPSALRWAGRTPFATAAAPTAACLR